MEEKKLIAIDTEFRQQYNSWYDNMKEITDEIIQKSFFEIEKGFTQYGIAPLDSYVVDDGWTNYSSFWDFNNKFPNELYNSSLQVNQLASNFGLWLGPRGGYGTERTIANWIVKDGAVQQIATPQEVFNHPANIFVAGFIGVPQMNFFDAQLVRSGNGFTVKTEDMNVALAPETCAQLALNWDDGDVKEITAGVRPEQILLADKGEEGALQGTVEVTELMGSTEHVHVTAPDGQFVLIIPVVDLEAKGALKAGDTIWFKFEKNATHLFDKVSGKNLI